MASSLNCMVIPSVFIKAAYCLVSEFFWLLKNFNEIFLGQVVQFDSYWESSLKFGHQVTGLISVKSASGHEQNEIGANVPVLGLYRGPLDYRQQIPLDTLSGDITTPFGFPGNDFVDLIEETQFRGFQPSRLPWHLFFHCPVKLRILGQKLPAEPPRPLIRDWKTDLGNDFFEHALKIDIHIFQTGTRKHHRITA